MNKGHNKGNRACNLRVSWDKQKAAHRKYVGQPTCIVETNQTRRMLLIVDAPTYQRWQRSRSDAHPQRGVC